MVRVHTATAFLSATALALHGCRRSVRRHASRRLSKECFARSRLRWAVLPSSWALGTLGIPYAQARINNNAADLKGKTAVVTGASRGIGKGIAIGLGEAGATVFVTGRSSDAIRVTADLVTRAGGRGIPLLCDASDDEQVANLFQEISKQTGGKLDILINNAFQDPSTKSPETDRLLTEGAKFYQLPLAVWDDMHRVGLRSHYVASYYAVPLLKAAAKANPLERPLLCMTSSFGAVSYLFATAYGVGKAASDRLVRDLQVELGPEGIDCLSVWPGLVLTEKVQELIKVNPQRIDRVTGGQDPYRVAESPVLTGRVIASLAASEQLRKPPIITDPGLTGQVCIVAEAARALGIRDGGPSGSAAAELYGSDRAAAPSIRSLGFLAPGPLRNALPEALKGLAAPESPLANYDIRLPLEFMAQGPPPSDKQ